MKKIVIVIVGILTVILMLVLLASPFVYRCFLTRYQPLELVARYPKIKGLPRYLSSLDEEERYSILKESIASGNIRVIKELINMNIDVNHQYFYNRTPLHLAAEWNRPEIARLLLEEGANPDARGEGGYSVLGLAEKKNSEAVVKVLLSYGARGNSNQRTDYIGDAIIGKPEHIEQSTYQPWFEKAKGKYPGDRIQFLARERFDLNSSLWSVNVNGTGLRQEMSVEDLYESELSINSKITDRSIMAGPRSLDGRNVVINGAIFDLFDRKVIGDIGNRSRDWYWSDSCLYYRPDFRAPVSCYNVNDEKVHHIGRLNGDFAFVPALKAFLSIDCFRQPNLELYDMGINVIRSFPQVNGREVKFLGAASRDASVLLSVNRTLVLLDLETGSTQKLPFQGTFHKSGYGSGYIFGTYEEKDEEGIVRYSIEDLTIEYFHWPNLSNIRQIRYFNVK